MNWVTRVPYSARINSPWNKLFRLGCFSIRNFDDLPRVSRRVNSVVSRNLLAARPALSLSLRARKSRHGHRDIRAPERERERERVGAIRRGGILRCSTFRIVGQPSGRSSTEWNIRASLQFAYLTMNIRHVLPRRLPFFWTRCFSRWRKRTIS